MNLIPNFSDLSCTWWALSPSIQKNLQKLIPSSKTSWSWKVYKNVDGSWGFNIPALLTFNEKFINGTELCLDEWYKTLSGIQPEIGSKMSMEVSSKELNDATTSCTFLGDDDFPSLFEDGQQLTSIDKASYYIDDVNGLTLWLCQYLQFLFKEKPKKLWLKLVV